MKAIFPDPSAFTQVGLTLCDGGRNDKPYRKRFIKIVESLRDELGEEFSVGMDRWTGMAKAYQFNNWRVYTAQTRNEEVMAVIGIYQVPKRPSDEFWLGWFGVDPVYRQKAIGGNLLRHAIAMAQNKGGKVLRLYTSPKNFTAHRLYKNHGFEMQGILEEYPPMQEGASSDSIVYSLSI